METINFNDFTAKERYDIIKEFLVKMREANSMPSKDLHVKKFFEHYLRKFYKMPDKLVNDIAYCQRAMKSHLATHQTIVEVFGEQEDADPVIKNNYLNELEEMLYQLNAECQYLVLRLQDDIDRFCLAFTEHGLKPDELVIKDIVSQSVVPLIVDPELSLKPYFVLERPNEDQLLRKYFIIETTEIEGPSAEDVQSPPEPSQLQPPPEPQLQPPPEPSQLQPPPEPQLQPPAEQLLPSKYTDNVKESRLNLRAALKRARSQSKQAEKVPENDPETRSKEYYMQSMGLCTHQEHQQLKLSMIQLQKRKPKPSEKAK